MGLLLALMCAIGLSVNFTILRRASVVVPDAQFPALFPLQSAMEAAEHVLTFITSEYDGRTPPVRFLVTAWAGTIHYFSENMRMTRRTAKEVIENIGGWGGDIIHLF